MTGKPTISATDSTDDPPPVEAKPTPESKSAAAPQILPPTATNTSGFHASVPQRHHVEAHPTGKRLGLLSLTALGIVYGDIGTSPLYALQQCFTSKTFSIEPTTDNVYGVVSLIMWSLILVVVLKYLAS